ncbi:MAG: hypothetical protein F6K00_21690 [Leptolyngbya sp. SIOISBB]|nr:hypothetical protein [Leptolyngbya sp. SIOISBB]
MLIVNFFNRLAVYGRSVFNACQQLNQSLWLEARGDHGDEPATPGMQLPLLVPMIWSHSHDRLGENLGRSLLTF